MSVPEDWDFMQDTNWSLSPAKYISSPSSLSFNLLGLISYANRGVCKNPAVANIKEGILEWNCLVPVIGYGREDIYIRLQPPHTNWLTPWGYQLVFHPASTGYYRVENGAQVKKIFTPSLAGYGFPGVWYKARLRWWITYDYQNKPSLRTYFEVYINGEWVDKGHGDDPNPIGAASEENRISIGFSCNTRLYPPLYIDDVKISKYLP